MKSALIAFCLAALVPAVLSAQPVKGEGEVLVSCTVAGGKHVSLIALTTAQPMFLYRYGPVGAPELEFRVPMAQSKGFAPWHGVGRAITNGVTLYNGDFGYTVWTSLDRLADKDPAMTAGVQVMQGEEVLASIPCLAQPEPLVASAFGIEDAMAAAGMEFDAAAERWILSK